MSRLSAFLFLGVMCCSFCFGQQADTLIYDASTGDYIVRYKTTLPFARKQDGTLRRLTIEDILEAGEQYVELDTLVTVIWEPATKTDPSIFCSVSQFSETEKAFSYRLMNGVSSKQRLLSFILEYGEGVNVRSQTTNGWYNGQMYEPGAIRLANRWNWGAIGEGVSGVEPGDSQDGFMLVSSGLPGIGKSYVEGWRNKITEFPGGGPKGEVGRQLSRLKTFPGYYVIRLTIVPVKPPEPFVPLTFLDTLISYKHQAFALGWIKNQGIVQSLDAKLENAQAQLRRNNTTAAKKILQAFVNEVEVLWKEESPPYGGTQITSEAYALLKFNAEYLISKL